MAEETLKAKIWFHEDTGSVVYLRPITDGGHGFRVKLKADHLPRMHDELRETWHGDAVGALVRVAHLMEDVVPGDWTVVPDTLSAAAEPAAGTARGPAGWEELRQQAAETAGAISAMLAEGQLVAEAELAANGISPVTVVHGDLESEADAEAISRLYRLAEQAGPTAGYHGGGDYVTFLFNGPKAGANAAAFTAQALGIAFPWWRITPTARPVWGQL